jgi:hypothetical protein
LEGRAYEFDFPEPLGPIMEVKYESPKRSMWCPLYDLKSDYCKFPPTIIASAKLTEKLQTNKFPHLEMYATVEYGGASAFWLLFVKWASGADIVLVVVLLEGEYIERYHQNSVPREIMRVVKLIATFLPEAWVATANLPTRFTSKIPRRAKSRAA